MLRALLLLFAILSLSPAHADPAEIKIGYVHAKESKERISLLDVPADNDGIAGAQLAIEDNRTTGRFLNQDFDLVDAVIRKDDDVVAAIDGLADKGASFVIVDVDAEGVLKASDEAQKKGVVIFNAGALDDSLREADCRANVIHVAPTRSMLADALAQYLMWKKWRRWLLVVGSHDRDKLYGEAIERAAKRFGAKIVETREFKDTGGARRTDSGVVQIQRQMPVFTQSAPDYDVLVAADESDVFAGYLPYRTWDARPVAGSGGLVPASWNPSFDQWGAWQLQNRFVRDFHRPMTALDMQAWTAARMIGEVAARSGSAEPAKMLASMKSPDFSVAAFKGQKLTLRDWNWQLRQPVLLFDGRNTVSVSPQEGYLHPVSELDTLGYDRPETKCKLP